MGVCCVVLDIDGMRFDFFNEFFKFIFDIEKCPFTYYEKQILFHVFFAFYAIYPTFKKNWVKKTKIKK